MPSTHKTFSEVLPPNVYVQSRDGEVLSQGMVLKNDYFPGVERADQLDLHVSGVPNFRRIEVAKLYGAGQPSLFAYVIGYSKGLLTFNSPTL